MGSATQHVAVERRGSGGVRSSPLSSLYGVVRAGLTGRRRCGDRWTGTTTATPSCRSAPLPRAPSSGCAGAARGEG
eukprot:3225427-Rhodomonas_salina.1